MNKFSYIENIATMVSCVVLILGALALGASGWSWLGLILLLNMNFARKPKTTEQLGKKNHDDCQKALDSKNR